MSINWKKKYRRNKHERLVQPSLGCWKGWFASFFYCYYCSRATYGQLFSALAQLRLGIRFAHSHTLTHTHTQTGMYLGPHLLRVPQTAITIDLRVHYLLDQSRPGEQAESGWMWGSPGLWSWQKLFIELHAISTGSPPKCQTTDRAVDCTERKSKIVF